MPREHDTYQPPLELVPPVEREENVTFVAGTTIFLETGGRGDLRTELEAKRLPKKIKGLTGFEALQRIDLVYSAWNTKYWSMPKGTRFGAFSRTTHPHKR